MKNINVQYFALFREQAGRAAETLGTAAETLADLFDELAPRRGLGRFANAKVAVNDELAAWSDGFADGDVVLFFPPVAGG